MAKRYNYDAKGNYRGFSTATPPSSNDGCLELVKSVAVGFGICIPVGLYIKLFEYSPLIGVVCSVIALVIWISVDERKIKKKEAARLELEQKHHAEQLELEQKQHAEQLDAQRRYESALQERENLRQELEQLRLMPTSSSGSISGRRIIRQIKMVVADNHRERDAAELAFLRQIKIAGGNAVINMRIRRHSGGYVSIQGDAVEL
ncbi:MAG: hypothetical protein ACKVY0_17325 [Prosthecobacter sp.]|uniref:hypothetical protein n=1 Tax=Prosthecobacter sp. TaxID=1965333 RepID=UPI0039035704